MVTKIEVFESVRPSLFSDALGFCLWGWIKTEVYKRKVDTQDDLLTCNLDAAARLKKGETSTRQTIRDLRTLDAECAEVDGGIFEHLLRTAINLSFKH
jgi:hypothetical protein